MFTGSRRNVGKVPRAGQRAAGLNNSRKKNVKTCQRPGGDEDSGGDGLTVPLPHRTELSSHHLHYFLTHGIGKSADGAAGRFMLKVVVV